MRPKRWHRSWGRSGGYREQLPVYSLHAGALALGGRIAIFTFLVTPVIFKSYPWDSAGEIVGKLFPAYFSYNLFITIIALILFLVFARDRSSRVYRISLALLLAALLINLFVKFKLHPEAVAVKQRVASFERESSESPERKKFARLHGLSAALNLCLLADGVMLLVINPLLKK